ncbi:MAG TPA: hypothetical protein VMF09_10310 [Solirubrobacteraceae bacterium]|nr:hypothetical protein [Solirubrobacteraceae bacterium]
MAQTLQILEAQNAVTPLSVDLDLLAAYLDALAAYEQAASSCAAAMSASGGIPDAVAAAASSVDVVAAARGVLTRSTGNRELARQVLRTAVTACEQSRAACAPHVEHHEHCRLHVAAADEAISTAKELADASA